MTGVLLGYRAIDTLLETVVLVPALVAVWSLATDPAWGGRPASPGPRDPGSALTLLAQVLPPVGILVGIHLLWIGADAPGGKFQGAVVLAAMWVLVLVAGLQAAPGPGRPAVALADRPGGPGLHRHRTLGDLARGGLPGLPGGPGQAHDPRHRDPPDPIARRHPGAALAGTAGGGPGAPGDDRHRPLRPVRRRSGGAWPLWPHLPPRSPAQDPRLQPLGRRRLPALWGHSPAGGRRRGGGRAGARTATQCPRPWSSPAWWSPSPPRPLPWPFCAAWPTASRHSTLDQAPPGDPGPVMEPMQSLYREIAALGGGLLIFCR